MDTLDALLTQSFCVGMAIGAVLGSIFVFLANRPEKRNKNDQA